MIGCRRWACRRLPIQGSVERQIDKERYLYDFHWWAFHSTNRFSSIKFTNRLSHESFRTDSLLWFSPVLCNLKECRCRAGVGAAGASHSRVPPSPWSMYTSTENESLIMKEIIIQANQKLWKTPSLSDLPFLALPSLSGCSNKTTKANFYTRETQISFERRVSGFNKIP